MVRYCVSKKVEKREESPRVRDPEGERGRVMAEILCAHERERENVAFLMHASRDSRGPFIV
jgi:hypothetical protein